LSLYRLISSERRKNHIPAWWVVYMTVWRL
jgi:hypothetical protein